MKKILLSIFLFIFGITFFSNITFAQSASTQNTPSIKTSKTKVLTCADGQKPLRQGQKFYLGTLMNFVLGYTSNISIEQVNENGMNTGKNYSSLCNLYFNKPGSFNALVQFSNITGVFLQLGLIMSFLWTLWIVLRKEILAIHKESGGAENTPNGDDKSLGALEVVSLLGSINRTSLIIHLWKKLMILCVVTGFFWFLIVGSTLHGVG